MTGSDHDRNATPRRVIIMGAAGRDFHNFNTVYRDDPGTRVVAFTAAQIPDIAGRRYPPALAGPRYPEGIPIVDEAALPALCREAAVDQVVFAYSDVAHVDVMHKASAALAAGPDFVLLGPRATMLRARVPVIAVCAVRTGCGKSQVTRWLSKRVEAQGLRAAVVRHPMPYGDLARQRVQRFATRQDLADAACTVEEREEYEPHLDAGHVVFAGVDYGSILEVAQAEADLILWDGGNNDMPFVAPDLTICLVDPHRPHDATRYHPGEAVLRMADIVLVAKSDTASAEQIETATEAARRLAPAAPVLRGGSAITLDQADSVAGRSVLVIEDGPTLTHGGMPWGAGYIAATRARPAAIVDPRPAAAPAIAAVLAAYPHIGPVLPAIGYGPAQLEDLRRTINASEAEIVVSGTPCDLAALIAIDKPVLRARYGFVESEEPGLGAAFDGFLARRGLLRPA